MSVPSHLLFTLHFSSIKCCEVEEKEITISSKLEPVLIRSYWLLHICGLAQVLAFEMWSDQPEGGWTKSKGVWEGIWAAWGVRRGYLRQRERKLVIRCDDLTWSRYSSKRSKGKRCLRKASLIRTHVLINKLTSLSNLLKFNFTSFSLWYSYFFLTVIL